MSSAFDEIFKKAVAEGPKRLLPGVALAAAGTKGDDYLNAFGTQRLDPSSPPVKTDTVMWLASCTKLVASIAALQCVERGLFDLDSSEDVDRLLPEWKDPQILTSMEDGPQLRPAKEKITLARLLSHTSGLTYDFFPTILKQYRESKGDKLSTIMRRSIPEAFGYPLLCEPGEKFMYSPGIDLAGLMVARANSCTLEEYMRKNIFSVVGMNDTSFRPVAHNNIAERLMPITTRPSPDELLTESFSAATTAHRYPPLEPTDDYGGSGLFSTAEDYLKLLKSILRDDGKLLKPETAALMFKSVISDAAEKTVQWTLSIEAAAAVMIPGEPLVGTPGGGKYTHGLGGLIGLTDSQQGFKAPWIAWGGAPNLRWWIDREGGSCGIFATQLYPPGERKHQVLTSLFEKEMGSRFAKSEG